MVGASVDAEYNSTPPHIALEVVLSSSGIDKLAVYSGLEVREVWFWDGKQFSLHGLEGSRYVVLERSRFLPELDLTLLALFVGERDQTAAAREYLRRLRGH
jgi:Uma2 family endonuclease